MQTIVLYGSGRRFNHGFTKNAFGEKVLLDTTDYRNWTFHSNAHAAHPNSATYLDSSTILATLFHHGLLIKIHKDSGKYAILVAGLKMPHSIRKACTCDCTKHISFSVCDTRGKRVLLLNSAGLPIDAVRIESPFIQDAVIYGQNLFCVLNIDVKVQSPEDFNCVVQIDLKTKLVVKTVSLARNTHPFSVHAISVADAVAWGYAWLAEQYIDRAAARTKFLLLLLSYLFSIRFARCIEKLWKDSIPSIIAVYLHGSRVRFLETESSDWDYLVVCEYTGSSIERHFSSDRESVDVCVLDVKSIERQLKGHNLWTIAAVFSPGWLILQETRNLRELFVLDYPTLWKSALFHSSLQLTKASKR